MAFLNACWFVAGSNGLSDFSDGTAQTGFRNLSGAGAVNGETYSYRAESLDRTEWEMGTGVYSSAGGGSLSRATIWASSAGTSKINFTAAPLVSLQPVADELNKKITMGKAIAAAIIFGG